MEGSVQPPNAKSLGDSRPSVYPSVHHAGALVVSVEGSQILSKHPGRILGLILLSLAKMEPGDMPGPFNSVGGRVAAAEVCAPEFPVAVD